MDALNHLGAVDLRHLFDVEEEFSDATSLGVITVDYQGEPVTSACGFCQFCLEMRKDPEQRLKCYACDAHGGLQAAIAGKPYIYRCHAGLIDFSIPITHKDQYAGAILCGQVKTSTTNDSEYLLGRDESWRSNELLNSLYDEITTTSISRVQSAASMLETLTRSLVDEDTDATVIPLAPALGQAVPARLAGPALLPATPGTAPGGDTASGTAPADMDEFSALQLSVENEDLPGAVAALTDYLNDLFASSGRYVGKDRLVNVEDKLMVLADSVCQTASTSVKQTVHRRRTRQGNHLNRYACQVYLEALLHTIIIEAGRAHPSHTMSSLLNHIEHNPTRAWTLHEAASYLGVSCSRLSKRFKAYTGKNFVAYISEKRIARAKLMLRYTDMPVVRIAKELNFLPNYFSRVFKLSTGMPPSQYRERFSGGLDG